MAFKRFGVGLTTRVVLLAANLTGLSAAILAPGYYGATLLLALSAGGLVFELYRFIGRTNAELARFLEAAHHGDFSQRFQASHGDAGFESLATALGEITTRFKASLQQGEERSLHLKALTEHIPVPLLSLFPDGRIELHNHAARRLFGRIAVNKIEDLRVFGDEFLQGMKSLEPGSRGLAQFTDDGYERQLTVVATEFIVGEKRETLISLQDIQAELDDAQSRAWGDLVRVLTHEIMNSITPITSLVTTAGDLVEDVQAQLERGGAARDELVDLRRAVDTAARRSDSLARFVKSYRDVSFRPTPRKREHSLCVVVRRVESLFAVRWRELGIGFSVTLDPKDLRLFADPDLVEQILINLLKNAEQALAGRDDPRVTLVGRLNRRGFVLVEVADNGPGVPEALAREIFVPFFSTKREGSGVGLALTRQIMIAHGGGVAVGESDSGGAKFSLRF